MDYFCRCLFLVITLNFWTFSSATGTDTIYQLCHVGDPVGHDLCPRGYCCVKDEFAPTTTYCERIGQAHDACSVDKSETNCPCATGLYCKPNIETAVFVSMYGTCHNNTSP